MRFLKNKIAKSRQLFLGYEDRAANEQLDEKTQTKSSQIDLPYKKAEKPGKEEEKLLDFSKKSIRKELFHDKKGPAKQSASSKNIVKNFGRAILSFILSDISQPYLHPLIKKKGVKLEDFRSFVSTIKESIDGISSFRRVLLFEEGETPAIQAYKEIVKELAVVFIKSFSVNWIFNSKLRDKIAHLKCRFKILRRVMDPEHFTYLKTFN